MTNRTKTKKLWALGLAVVVVLALVSGCKANPQGEAATTQTNPPVVVNAVQNETRNLISISGNGVMTVELDMAEITLSVTTLKPTPEDAQSDNNEAMEKVHAAVREFGIADADIQTMGLNMSEEYDYSKQPHKLIGYRVNNSLKVSVRDLSILGDMVAKAVEAGATSYGGLTYKLADSTEPYALALGAALDDAKRKAQTIADQAGADLVPIPVSLYEAYTETASIPRTDDTRAVAVPQTDAVMDTSVPTTPGSLEVRASINVTYEIVPKQ